MCMSPHEMSSVRIEEQIASLEDRIEHAEEYHISEYSVSYMEHKVRDFKAILEERREAGTYDDDHTDRSGFATARQGRSFR